jgi:hypothetical protein
MELDKKSGGFEPQIEGVDPIGFHVENEKKLPLKKNKINKNE